MEQHGVGKAKFAFPCGLEFIYETVEIIVEFGC